MVPVPVPVPVVPTCIVTVRCSTGSNRTPASTGLGDDRPTALTRLDAADTTEPPTERVTEPPA